MAVSPAEMGKPLPRISILALLAFCLGGCSSLQVPVRPPAFSDAGRRTAETEGVSVSAEPVIGRARYWELFDEDLPELGIAAIQIAVENHRIEAVDLGAVDFRLRTQIGLSKPLSPSKLLKTFYKRKKIRMYTQHADLKARRNLGDLIFQAGEIGPGARRSGLLFFDIRRAGAASWNRKAVVQVRGLKLPDGTRVQMDVPLHHAEP